MDPTDLGLVRVVFASRIASPGLDANNRKPSCSFREPNPEAALAGLKGLVTVASVPDSGKPRLALPCMVSVLPNKVGVDDLGLVATGLVSSPPKEQTTSGKISPCGDGKPASTSRESLGSGDLGDGTSREEKGRWHGF